MGEPVSLSGIGGWFGERAEKSPGTDVERPLYYPLSKEGDTKLTNFEEVPLLEDAPCKLSFEKLTSTDGDNVAAKFQNVKLFLSPDIEIPAGCKIIVNRFHDVQRKFTFSHSGEAGVFTHHQEIYLELWKGWA